MALTRDELLADIRTRLGVIQANKAYIDGKISDADDARALGDWSLAITHMLNAISVGYDSLYWFAYRYAAPEEEYMLWVFLRDFTVAEAEITWKSIVSAWIDADITGRLWTVATLDELRKEAWDEPFEGIYIKAGKKPT